MEIVKNNMTDIGYHIANFVLKKQMMISFDEYILNWINFYFSNEPAKQLKCWQINKIIKELKRKLYQWTCNNCKYK